MFLIMFSFNIENKTYKIYYFLCIGLATITILNVYLGVVYYIKLRNEPGMPGPRGPQGDKGPKGATGKCIINEKCGFTPEEAEELIYTSVATKFDTTEKCLRNQDLESCGNAKEVVRVGKLNGQIETLKSIAAKSTGTKQQFETKLRSFLFE